MIIDPKIKNITLIERNTTDVDEQHVLVYDGRHYKINGNLAVLIYFLQHHTTTEEAAKAIYKSTNLSCATQQLDKVISKYINPIFEVAPPTQKTQFTFKHEILPKHIVSRFSTWFRFLFKPAIMYPLIGIAFILNILFYIFNPLYLLASIDNNLYSFLAALLFLLFSVLFHELGHVSACRYNNIEHGGIGIGLYITIPVFYSDVTNAWVLEKSKRIIINIAGVYFQLLILIPLLIINTFHPSYFLQYMILVLNFNFLFTLNPFFKFDGYWIVSDLLGIANLRNKTQEMLTYFLRIITFKKNVQKPAILKLNKTKRNIFIAYALITNLFFGYFFIFVIPVFIYQYFKQMPSTIKSFLLNAAAGRIDFSTLFSILTQSIMLLLIFFLLYKVLSHLSKAVLSKKKKVLS